MLQLTELAHSLIKPVLRPGDTAIDATAGNGHDTLFLAEYVGAQGIVHGFDIQPAAILRTQQRLAEAGHQHVRLHHRSHADLMHALPDLQPGSVSAVTMNLGYLPGGDKLVTTQACSTLEALRQSLLLLRQDGIMTIMAYVGHYGGASEATAVEHFLKQLPGTMYLIDEPCPSAERIAAPRLFVIRKIRNEV